jgi:hypothetical protein
MKCASLTDLCVRLGVDMAAHDVTAMTRRRAIERNAC